MSLHSKVAIVTGGARGIGQAIAHRLLKEGAKVVIADIDNEVGAKAADNLSSLGEAVFVHCDVGDKLDVHNLLAASIDAYGAIDILINNAGVSHSADFLEIDEADFDRVIRINLKGMFLCGQAIAKHMVERAQNGEEPGAIVNMSSVNETFAIPTQVPYCVSKGGVSQLTRVMALSLAPHGIRVNAIGPGSIMTDMLMSVNSDPEAKNRILARTPMGRIGDVSEIASIAAFLASNDASYITGQTIFADGGRLPLNYTCPVPDDV